MSLAGYLAYGDRGPIVGAWPVDRIRSYSRFVAGDRIVIDNGHIRHATRVEAGVALPEGSSIDVEIDVPPWWWWLHFGELLRSAEPARCCGDGPSGCAEYCADCPRIGAPVDEQLEFSLGSLIWPEDGQS